MDKKTGELFTKTWPKIIAKAWANPTFKKKLLAHPKEIFQEYGIDFPSNHKIKINENKENISYFVLPNPSSRSLSEKDLGKIAAADSPCSYMAPLD